MRSLLSRRLAFYTVTGRHPLHAVWSTVAVRTPGLGHVLAGPTELVRSAVGSGRVPGDDCPHAPVRVPVVGVFTDVVVDATAVSMAIVPGVDVPLVPARTVSCPAGHVHMTAVRPSWTTDGFGRKAETVTAHATTPNSPRGPSPQPRTDAAKENAHPSLDGVGESPTPESEGSDHA